MLRMTVELAVDVADDVAIDHRSVSRLLSDAARVVFHTPELAARSVLSTTIETAIGPASYALLIGAHLHEAPVEQPPEPAWEEDETE